MSLWSRWKALLARKETGEALAAFRVVIAIGALWSLLMPLRSGAWRLLWTDAGYLPSAPPVETVGAVIAVGALAGTALLVGWHSRVAAFVTLQSTQWIFAINPSDGGAHDRYLNNALWLLVLASADASWSLRARLRDGTWRSDRLVSSWPRYVAIFQLVLTYWATGVQKIGPEWTPFGDFTAVWYIVRSPLYLRLDSSWIPYPATQVITAVTWIWEWGAPVWLFAFWARDKRPPDYWSNRIDLRTLWATWGVGMHGMLFVLTVLGPLQWLTVAWYTTLFHPDEYRRLAGRLRGLVGLSAPAAPPR